MTGLSAGAATPGPTLADPAGIGPGDVVVLRALGLGDTVVAAAALRGLRRRFPGHRLVIAAPPPLGAWLEREGLVDAVLPASGLEPLPAMPGGHVAVNLHGSGPRSHEVLEATRPAALIAFARPGDERPGLERWRADEHEVDRWCRLVRAAGGPCGRDDVRLRPRRAALAAAHQPRVIVHPGAASASRRWPVERWREVAGALAATGARVEVTGAAGERALAAAVVDGVPGAADRSGRDDVLGLADAIARADLVLSGDTGIAHLATAYAVASVTLFGPVPPARWGPSIDADLHAALWHGDPDAASWGDPHGDRVDPRLAAVTADEVLDAARRLMPALGTRATPRTPPATPIRPHLDQGAS